MTTSDINLKHSSKYTNEFLSGIELGKPAMSVGTVCV